MFLQVFHVIKAVACKFRGRTTLMSLVVLSLVFFLYLLFSGLFVFLAVFIYVVVILYKAQDHLLFHPDDPQNSRDFVTQPSNYKLPYESLKLETKDGIHIHMFFIKQNKTSSAPTILFFHGNAGNIGQRLGNVSGFFHHLEVNVLIVEYRGYGMSEGSPSEQGFYRDAQASFDYLMNRPDVDKDRIIVFGRSLGGAVAIDLAQRPKYKSLIWALIVENTFTSVPEMSKVILKWKCLRYLPKFFHKNKFNSIHKMPMVTVPTLIICGTNDNLVPPSMAEELYTKCGSVHKRLAMIQGGGHNDTWTCSDYYPTFEQFINHLPPPNKSRLNSDSVVLDV